MLTSADLEEIKEDIHFFLDEFGSTGAVRRKLQAQLKEIERLGFTVRRLQGRRDKAQEPKDENTEESEEKDAMDEVDRIQADVEFFLKAFGSTRVVRERLESQRQEIEDLRRTVKWMEERERRKEREGSGVEGEASVVPLVSVLRGGVGGLQRGADTKKAKHHLSTRGSTSNNTSSEAIGGEMTTLQYKSLKGFGHLHDSETRGPTLGELVEQTYSELLQLFPPGVADTGKRSPTSWKLPSSSKKKQRVHVRQEDYGLRIQSAVTTAKSDADVRSPSLVDASRMKNSRWLSPRKCNIRGCDKHQGLGGYCSDHDLNSIVGRTRCKSRRCKKRAMFREHCLDHRKNPRSPRPSGINQPVSPGTPRSNKICKVAGCMKWAMRNGNLPLYCVDHQGWLGLEITDTENVRGPRPANTREIATSSLTVKRKGHTTCKIHRCMKWVMRDDSIYCVKHESASSRETPDADSKTVPTEEAGTHSSHHEIGVSADATTGSKYMRRQHSKNRECKEPGCTKNAKRKGLCKTHGGSITCKAEGCRRHEYVRGYCHGHSRTTGRRGSLSGDEWTSS